MQTNSASQKMGTEHMCTVLFLCLVVGFGFSLMVPGDLPNGMVLQFIVGLVTAALFLCALGVTFDKLKKFKLTAFLVFGAKSVPISGIDSAQPQQQFRPPRYFPTF